MRPWILAFSLLLVAWPLAGAPAQAGDPAVSLGRNWGAVESFNGAVFRWVDNDAEVRVGGSGIVAVALDVEAGPGLGRPRFVLRALDTGGRQTDAVEVTGRQTVRLYLPARATYRLHVDGGGRHVKGDRRVLDFRAFSIVAGGANALLGEIASPPIRIGGGWYPVEFYGGEAFRWVANDARFTVDAGQTGTATLSLVAEPGPGLAGAPLSLTVFDAQAHRVHQARMNHRSTVSFRIALHRGANEFRLHADGGGRSAPNDRRTLNFRVVSISLR